MLASDISGESRRIEKSLASFSHSSAASSASVSTKGNKANKHIAYMATSWSGAQQLAGQSVSPFGDMCDSSSPPPISPAAPLHSRLAGRQCVQPQEMLPQTNSSSSSLHSRCHCRAADKELHGEADGRIDKQTERHLSLAANNKDDSGSSHVLAAVGLSSRRNTLPQRRRPAKVPGSTWPAPLGRL